MNAYATNESGAWSSLEIISGQVAAAKFTRLNRQARMANLWNRLIGRSNTPIPYERERSQFTRITALDRGVKEIPVKSIAGSVNRAGDYDREFRPLNPALKKRWIDVHVLAEGRGWEPITVHKIGERYFVEDGHHRVSVARYSGWDSIEARVYESQLDPDVAR